MLDVLDAALLGPPASASGNTWASSIRYPFIASTRSVRRSQRLRCVLGMLSSLEVKVLWPT